MLDVIVVGCGASGVAALSRLQTAGLRALGLEAAGSTGGRVCSQPREGARLDVGAAWKRPEPSSTASDDGVIVVGCGASGVAALSRLQTVGLRALGLEAAGSTGGRVCSQPQGGARLDIGAAWKRPEPSSAASDDDDDVIVVGCGASGIAALSRLQTAGLRALGLEAAGSTGGRVCSQPREGARLDVGAAWCHGEEDNIVFELANPLGLLGRPEPDNKWFVLSDGELVSNDEGESITDALNEELAKADKNNSRSISEFVREAANTNATLKKNPKLTSSFVEWFERNSHVGGQNDPRTGKSLRGLAECWPCRGEFMLNWKGRGYHTIIDILLNRYPDPSKELPVDIFLNKEVECIKWRPSQSTHGGQVVVKCTDGSVFEAKSVIVTVSLGVLKERHTTLFNPPLPAEKGNTINNLQFCVLDKIYIEFERAWWPQTPANFTILWREEDKAKISKENQWITEIYGLQTVEYHPNVLLAWIYGDGAEEMEKVSLEGVRAGIEKVLDVLRKNFDVAPIKDILRSQWASNRLTRGAYAYRSVATEQDGGSAILLSEPLCNGDRPVVCFAGEATSHHRHGAVHGAIEAGFREADRLIDSFKK